MKRILLAVVLCVIVSGEARAQVGARPFLGLGGGWGGAGGASNQMFGFAIPPSNLQDRMPHFALYPPAYYSYPVPRPYGYSPFAYPGITPTPYAAVEPQTIVNPYYDSAPATSRPRLEPRSPSDVVPAPSPTPAPLKKSSKSPSTNNRVGQTRLKWIANPFYVEAIARRGSE